MSRLRNITACKRCRIKRIKCDKQFPKCSNCLRRGVECLSIDVGTGETVSRSYVYELETQVDQLKQELSELKSPLITHGQVPNEVVNQIPNQIANIVPTTYGTGNSAVEGVPMHKQANVQHQTDDRAPYGPPATNILSSSSTQTTVESTQWNTLGNYKFLFMTDDQINKVKSLADDLPSKAFIEKCINLYFRVSNVQLPILHYKYFMDNYFNPLYQDHEGVRSNNLFFVYIILAISTSLQQHEYPLSLSYEYQQLSLKHVDYIWTQHSSESNNLEKIQSYLLLTVYSLMRPAIPGCWYVMGTTIRILYDLGLHQDSELQGETNMYIIDMKRRVFWSCYCLDRQISTYFKKPFGILQETDVRFPLLLKDSVINSAIESHEIDPSKYITLQYFELRLIQNRIHLCGQDLIQSQHIYEELNHWLSLSLKLANLDLFNKLIFELNYHQGILSLFKFMLFQPGYNIITNRFYFSLLFTSCSRIIEIYYDLQNNVKLLNYSWVSINNIFSSGITYLFIIYYVDFMRKDFLKLDKFTILQDLCNKVLEFLTNLKPICSDSCEQYIRNFKDLKANVVSLIDDERLFEINFDIFDDSEFINSMIGSVNTRSDFNHFQ